MAKILIWGASGHAAVVADIIRADGKHDIAGFIDSIDSRCREFYGGEVLGGDAELTALIATRGITAAIVGIGNSNVRMRLAKRLEDAGLTLIQAIHPRATVSPSAQIGVGTAIDAGAIVCARAIVGKNVIINTSASVNHDCLIEDDVHICPGSHLAGNVIVRKGSWVGLGSTVIEKTEIGAYSFIGAGSVVVSDIPPQVIAYGAPARIIGAHPKPE